MYFNKIRLNKAWFSSYGWYIMGYKVCIKQERVLCNLGYKFEVDTLWTCFFFFFACVWYCWGYVDAWYFLYTLISTSCFKNYHFPPSLKWPQNVHSWSYLKDACRDTTGMDFDHPWSSRILEFFPHLTPVSGNRLKCRGFQGTPIFCECRTSIPFELYWLSSLHNDGSGVVPSWIYCSMN